MRKIYECCHFLSLLRCDWAGAISKTHTSHFIGVSKHSKTIKALELGLCMVMHVLQSLFPCLFSYAYILLCLISQWFQFFLLGNAQQVPCLETLMKPSHSFFEVVRSVHSMLTIWNMLAHDCVGLIYETKTVMRIFCSV